MRILALLALSLLGACGGASQPKTDAGCHRSASHDIIWSNPRAPDVVTARAEGPSCAQAIVTLAIRDARGDPLWAFAATHFAMQAGEGALPEAAPAVSDDAMDAFLSNWANLTIQKSTTLPQWREGDARLTGETFSYHTDFDRDAYEMLRTRDLPMICYAAGVETVACLVVDPFSHAPAQIVAYGP
ncbi:MAG: hypothetical protein ABL883_06500 [Terricaulis sp.]